MNVSCLRLPKVSHTERRYFLKFLLKHNVYNEWLYCFGNDLITVEDFNDADDLIGCLRCGEHYNVPLGDDFWEDLYCKWMELNRVLKLKKNGKQIIGKQN